MQQSPPTSRTAMSLQSTLVWFALDVDDVREFGAFTRAW